jgi:hypothetical protein
VTCSVCGASLTETTGYTQRIVNGHQELICLADRHRAEVIPATAGVQREH